MKQQTRIDLLLGINAQLQDVLETYQQEPVDEALELMQSLISSMESELGRYRWEAENPGLFVMEQEADLHRLALAEYDRQFAELPVDVQAECKAKVTAELDSHVHPTFAQILASMRPV